jgi:hypothetical protein
MRRKRFNVRLNKGNIVTERSALVYPDEFGGFPQRWRDYYERLGYEVLSAEPAARKRQAAAGRPCAYELNPSAVRAAKAQLGIEGTVKVRRTTAGDRYGCCRSRYNRATGQWTHHITIPKHESREKASNTFWHELTHASQAERAETPEAWAKLVRQQHRLPHRRRPIEIEAYRVAEENSDKLLTAPKWAGKVPHTF